MGDYGCDVDDPHTLRPLPPDIAAWGSKVLPPDDPYRHIDDMLATHDYNANLDYRAGANAARPSCSRS
jgi:hypothetical protein